MAEKYKAESKSSKSTGVTDSSKTFAQMRQENVQ